MIPKVIRFDSRRIHILKHKLNTNPRAKKIVYGQYNPPDQILIDIDQGREHIPDTLLHEVLHICFIYAKIRKGMREEEIVSRLTPVLLKIIAQNPNFIKYISKGE